MAKEELVNNRDLDFSSRHRKFPKWCYASDVDFLEFTYINNLPIQAAILEVKRWIGVLDKEQRRLLIKIADQLKIPAFFIKYILEPTNEKDKEEYKRLADKEEELVVQLEIVRRKKHQIKVDATYKVEPLNAWAEEDYFNKTKMMSEDEFIELLDEVRQRKIKYEKKGYE